MRRQEMRINSIAKIEKKNNFWNNPKERNWFESEQMEMTIDQKPHSIKLPIKPQIKFKKNEIIFLTK